ncbi:Penicillin-binding protein 1C [Dissophora ornata]|nr:Penicillin-binding protein 1C [Dissophora ornata]
MSTKIHSYSCGTQILQALIGAVVCSTEIKINMWSSRQPQVANILFSGDGHYKNQRHHQHGRSYSANTFYPSTVLLLKLVAVLGIVAIPSLAAEPQAGKTKPLANLDKVLENLRIRNGVPGMSVAIIRRGKLIYAKDFGKRNEHDPFTAETVIPIASLTKVFAAATIEQLVADGKMD